MGRPVSTYPKPCKECGVSFPVDAFPKAGNKGTGRRARCYPCHAAYERALHLQKAAGAGAPYKPRVRADPASGFRLCRTCEVSKPAEQFAKGQRECRDCRASRGARYRAENADKEAERHRRYHFENRETLLPKFRALQRARYYRDPERARQERRDYWNRLTVEERRAVLHRQQESRYRSWARRRALKLGSRIARISRRRVIERDGSTCYLCLRTLTSRQVHLDHVVPLARGGSHTEDNLRVACGPCNRRKSDRLLSELDLSQFAAAS